VGGWKVKYSLSLPEVAFRWLQHHSELGKISAGDAIIIGASSVEQLNKNIAWKYVLTLILAISCSTDSRAVKRGLSQQTLSNLWTGCSRGTRGLCTTTPHRVLSLNQVYEYDLLH
jgi:hypothetical protein